MEVYKTYDYLKVEYIEKNRTEQDIANEFNIDPKLLHYYIKKNNLTGLKSKIKNTVNVRKFNINNPIFCYYAGLIATDGYIDLKNGRVSVRVQNEGSNSVLNCLKDYFEYTGEVRKYKKSYDLTITSKELIQKLKSLNVCGEQKSYSLKFPTIMSGNEDCQRMFLRGILDGDGNIHISYSNISNQYIGGQFRIVEGSYDFIQGLINYLNRKFKFNYEVSVFKSRGVEYPKLEMKVKDSLIFYDWVYKNYPDFRFSDKYSKYLKLKER